MDAATFNQTFARHFPQEAGPLWSNPEALATIPAFQQHPFAIEFHPDLNTTGLQLNNSSKLVVSPETIASLQNQVFTGLRASPHISQQAKALLIANMLLLPPSNRPYPLANEIPDLLEQYWRSAGIFGRKDLTPWHYQIIANCTTAHATINLRSLIEKHPQALPDIRNLALIMAETTLNPAEATFRFPNPRRIENLLNHQASQLERT